MFLVFNGITYSEGPLSSIPPNSIATPNGRLYKTKQQFCFHANVTQGRCMHVGMFVIIWPFSKTIL